MDRMSDTTAAEATQNDAKKHGPKHFVLDTNVLLHNPNALFVFEDNHVVIPYPVIEELDTMKRREDDIGASRPAVHPPPRPTARTRETDRGRQLGRSARLAGVQPVIVPRRR